MANTGAYEAAARDRSTWSIVHRGPRSLVYRTPAPEGGTQVRKTARAHTAARRAQLRREYELLRSLRIPGVVEAISLQDDEVAPTLVLADAGNQDLATRLRRGPLPVEEFFSLAIHLAKIVAEVHRCDVIHRDIHPSNIVLGADGETVTLIDFGLASAATETGARLEGRLHYLAPEQTGRTDRAVDARSDLYSLGATYFEMLTGSPPFVVADPAELVHAHLALAPPPASDANPAVPRGLSDIVARLLAKAPEHRYQCAEALLDDLRRAERAYRTHRAVESFELGRSEPSEELPAASQLHGREQELAILRAALERARAGGSELVLLMGPEGMGKSALVRTLGRSLKETRADGGDGACVTVRFEALRAGAPYAALIESFREHALPRREGPASWDSATELNPSLAELLEQATPAPSANPREAVNRFRRLFHDFICALATAERPLLLHLDDLQWADAASLNLIEALALAADVHHVLIVFALRDVPADHPARRTLASIERARGELPSLTLAPLDLDAVIGLTADVLGASRESVRPLAAEILRKSAGSPLFAERFLRVLHRTRLLRFEPSREEWVWDLERIAATEILGDVVDLMVTTIAALPAEVGRVVQVAACLPNDSQLGLLAKIAGVPWDETQRAMARAAREGLIVLGGPDAYTFAHERVRQAAYAMLDEDERTALHLAAGRALLEDPPEHGRLFDAVGQLERGAGHIDDPAERRHLAELEHRAGVEARSSGALSDALAYFKHGIERLGDEVEHGLSFALHRDAAEAAYFTGAPELGDVLWNTALSRAEGPVEAAELYDLQAVARAMMSEPAEALSAARTGLALFDIELPDSDLDASLCAELKAVRLRLLGRSADELLALPLMRDPAILVCARLLTHAHAVSWVLDARLASIAAVRLVRLSLEHGNASESAHAYVLYAIVLREVLSDYERARTFERLGIELNRRLGDRRIEGRVLVAVGSLGLHWSEPLRASIPLIRRAMAASLESGDFDFVVYGSLSGAVSILGPSGMELARLRAEYDSITATLREVRASPGALSLIAELRQVASTLQGHAATPSGGPSDEVRDDFITCALATHRMSAAYILRDLPRAMQALRTARRTASALRGFFLSAQLNQFGSLTLIAQHEHEAPEECAAMRAEIDDNQRQMADWVKCAPSNFQHKHRLVAAELARLDERPLEEALALYDDAIEGASKGGFLYDEALANELAARACLARGRQRIARGYLLDAAELYLRWGASAKVSALEEELPELLRDPGAQARVDVGGGAEVDLLSWLKAAETLSSEVIAPRLLEKLMVVCLEAAGATYGALVLLERGVPMVRAHATIAEPVVLERAALRAFERAPSLLLEEVLRTSEPIVLGEASHDPRFGADPYLAGRRVKSALALPIRHQAKTLGALYLENQLVTRAFSDDRLRPLTLLSSQIAISLGNSLLFERQVRSERQARFLANVGIALAETLDARTTLTRIVRLAVPFIADVCFIDLVEPDGTLSPVAEAHVDPGKESALRELRRDYPLDRPEVPASIVRRTGEPFLRKHPVTDEELIRTVQDPELVERVRALGLQAALAVPLAARGETLGVLTLCSTTPGQTLEDEDLALAEEVARRAALSLDNARLYDEAKEAVRLRDEFMTVFAHELRTPTTALDLSVSLLRHQSTPKRTMDRFLPVIERQNARLKTLIETLLDQASVSAGRLPLKLQEVDLDAVVRTVAAQLEPDQRRAGSPLTIESEGPLTGRWDPMLLERVVTNLLGNAIKFGMGRPIEVRVERSGEEARLVVRDQGIGIEKERLPHVFDRFVRAVSSRHYGGLGLGLYVAREIVRALGGRVRAVSAIGEGSTFTVELPLAGPPATPP